MFSIMSSYNGVTIEVKRVDSYLEAKETVERFNRALGSGYWSFYFL